MSDVKVNTTRKGKYEIIDSTDYEEFACAMIGSVDAGKSTTVGVLSKNILDDGKGLARQSVMIHQHEFDTGNTSDIAYQYFKDDKRIYTFVDLAGHEKFLRTTITGLASGYPDFSICCISDKITQITKEHLSLVLNMGIPVIINFTKIDMIPERISKRLIEKMRQLMKKIGKTLFHCKSLEDYNLIHESNQHIPYILSSNKNGDGIELIRTIISNVKKRDRQIIDGFIIDHIYNVQGVGTVVSGQVGQEINKNDVLFLGPMSNGTFIKVKVKTIHNDYRHPTEKLNVGTRGCLGLGIEKRDRPYIRNGMILRHTVPEKICSTFQAKVKISHHHTTIKNGYQAFVNCGLIAGACEFNNIQVLEKKNVVDTSRNYARAGDTILVDIKFINRLCYIETGQKIIFREGSTKGIGEVIQVYPYVK